MDKLLVLDLDETLSHTVWSSKSKPNKYNLIFENSYYISFRPNLNEFLSYVFNEFEVGIFTSCTDDYVKFILSNITDLNNFKFIWTFDKCFYGYDLESNTYCNFKKLEKVSSSFNYNLKDILIIDDKPITAKFNYENLIPIRPFFDDDNDIELLKVVTYLDKIKKK